MSDAQQRKFKFIGCEIIYREACYLAATVQPRVDVQFLVKGLHSLETPDMVGQVQAAIDAVAGEAGYEAVLLGYGRCNDGLVGVKARELPLVIPRAHDCITFFFGSRGAYRRWFDDHPGTYYMTSGWAERNSGSDGLAEQASGRRGVMGNLGLDQSYEQLVARYGRDNADYIAATLGGWEKNYSDMLYLQMDVCEEGGFIAEARRRAGQRNWRFTLRDGDLALLRKLFEGRWDDDFVIVPPGGRIAARNDEAVLEAQQAACDP